MLTEVRAAGFLLFRRKEHVEFLLLQASYRDHHWSPPKGTYYLINQFLDIAGAYHLNSLLVLLKSKSQKWQEIWCQV